MSLTAQGRLSDSPFIESIWRGQAEHAHTLPCPADGRWNIRVTKLRGKVKITLEGPLAKATSKTHDAGVDWVVIKLKLGAYLPAFSPKQVLENEIELPSASDNTFWFNSFSWDMFNYDNADGFVDKLFRRDLLMLDPVVTRIMDNQPSELAPRTIRHRFVQTIGLPPSTIKQIERAREALTLLQNGTPILDVVYQMGYSDQPHLTRSLKTFMGHTPAKFPKYNYNR